MSLRRIPSFYRSLGLFLLTLITIHVGDPLLDSHNTPLLSLRLVPFRVLVALNVSLAYGLCIAFCFLVLLPVLIMMIDLECIHTEWLDKCQGWPG